jgi:serine/threonine protein kinase
MTGTCNTAMKLWCSDEESFAREVEALYLLQKKSRYIIRIIDMDMDSGYYTMPYYSLGTLSNYAGIEFMSADAKRSFARHVYEGIHAMHQEGIAHGDVSTCNILVRKTRVGGIAPVLCDLDCCVSMQTHELFPFQTWRYSETQFMLGIQGKHRVRQTELCVTAQIIEKTFGIVVSVDACLKLDAGKVALQIMQKQQL